ncbi:hypothetical protein BESB_075910 [Besnoitia besnoiti]|uniref:Uncharacterized protein n=1 Tax=Besnoitia besnoiti TaxID=94643 RepID=A0A2A9LYF3_BESBE|nr:uncharacterized protein BESB_075910 [Besnoitia besnoiti]PFH30819.1 hypothetical protein BESB_075910 [Besnoitia besnoiti]
MPDNVDCRIRRRCREQQRRLDAGHEEVDWRLFQVPKDVSRVVSTGSGRPALPLYGGAYADPRDLPAAQLRGAYRRPESDLRRRRIAPLDQQHHLRLAAQANARRKNRPGGRFPRRSSPPGKAASTTTPSSSAAASSAWTTTPTSAKGAGLMMWEVTTKKRYNLPYRWGYPSKGPPKGFAAKYEQQINENAEKFWEGMYLQEWYEWSLHQGQLAQAEAIANANAVPDVELYGDEFVSDEVVDPEMVLMEETENF